MTNKFKVSLTTLVLFIPVVHVIANVTTNYFPPGLFSPGGIRLIYMVFVIGAFFTMYKPGFKKLFIVVLIYLIYNLVLIIIQDDLVIPLINYIKLSIPFLVFFIGYKLINDIYKIESLFKYSIFALLLFNLNYLIANIFGLGGSAYLEDSFNIGGAGVGSANELAVFVVITIAFLMLNTNKRWNKFAILMVGFSMINILLSMRRGAFLTLAGALLIFIMIKGVDKKLTKYAFIAVALLIAAFPIYGDTFIERYNYRVESREGSLTNLEVEGRYFELTKVPVSLSYEGIHAWFVGTHNLNSAKYFGHRELHVGYMAILHGSGLIGISLFFCIIGLLIIKGRRFYRKFKNNHQVFAIFFALYFSLIVAILIYLLTSRLHGFSVTVPTFLMMGSILGTCKEFYNSKIYP